MWTAPYSTWAMEIPFWNGMKTQLHIGSTSLYRTWNIPCWFTFSSLMGSQVSKKPEDEEDGWRCSQVSQFWPVCLSTENTHKPFFLKPMLDLNIFPQMLHSSSLTVRRSPRSLGMTRENGMRANYKYGPLLEALSWRSFLLTLWIFYTIISFSFPLPGKIAKIDESCQKSHYWTSLLSPSSSPPETNEGSVSICASH